MFPEKSGFPKWKQGAGFHNASRRSSVDLSIREEARGTRRPWRSEDLSVDRTHQMNSRKRVREEDQNVCEAAQVLVKLANAVPSQESQRESLKNNNNGSTPLFHHQHHDHGVLSYWFGKRRRSAHGATQGRKLKVPEKILKNKYMVPEGHDHNSLKWSLPFSFDEKDAPVTKDKEKMLKNKNILEPSSAHKESPKKESREESLRVYHIGTATSVAKSMDANLKLSKPSYSPHTTNGEELSEILSLVSKQKEFVEEGVKHATHYCSQMHTMLKQLEERESGLKQRLEQNSAALKYSWYGQDA